MTTAPRLIREQLLALADELQSLWHSGAKPIDIDGFADRIRSLAAEPVGGEDLALDLAISAQDGAIRKHLAALSLLERIFHYGYKGPMCDPAQRVTQAEVKAALLQTPKQPDSAEGEARPDLNALQGILRVDDAEQPKAEGINVDAIIPAERQDELIALAPQFPAATIRQTIREVAQALSAAPQPDSRTTPGLIQKWNMEGTDTEWAQPEPFELDEVCREFVEMVGNEFGNETGVRLRGLFESLTSRTEQIAPSSGCVFCDLDADHRDHPCTNTQPEQPARDGVDVQDLAARIVRSCASRGIEVMSQDVLDAVIDATEAQPPQQADGGAVAPIGSYFAKRSTPEGTREFYGFLEPGVENLPHGTKLYAANPPKSPGVGDTRTVYAQRTKVARQVEIAGPKLYMALKNLLDAVEERPDIGIESVTISDAHNALLAAVGGEK